jgi:PAS domain S-box-containing protein
MTGTNANITERKQLERALSNTLRVLRALLETLPLPVILRDAEERVTLVNEAFEKMTDIKRQDIIGKPLDDYAGRIPVPNHRETDDEIFASRRSLRYQTSLTSADGTLFDRDRRQDAAHGRRRHDHRHRLRAHRHFGTEAHRGHPGESPRRR